MRLRDAKKIIDGYYGGYLVSFEKKCGSMLEIGSFPEPSEGDTPFDTEARAWGWAQKFASATRGKYVNISVIRATDYAPVPGYREKMILNY